MIHSFHEPNQRGETHSRRRDTSSVGRRMLRTSVLFLLAQSTTAQKYTNGATYGESDGHRPIALHQLVVVPASGDEVVALRGYDNDGDKLKATVTSLPGTGVVHQLSKVVMI